jgi:hypothetical protein
VDFAEKSRLEKLLGMLGSSFDGERANAARAIASMAERKKLTITELIYGHVSAQQPRSRPQPKKQEAGAHSSKPKTNTILHGLREIAENSEAYEFTLTDWECQFAADVSTRYSYDYELSEKQIIVAEKIIRKAETSKMQGT